MKNMLKGLVEKVQQGDNIVIESPAQQLRLPSETATIAPKLQISGSSPKSQTMRDGTINTNLVSSSKPLKVVRIETSQQQQQKRASNSPPPRISTIPAHQQEVEQLYTHYDLERAAERAFSQQRQDFMEELDDLTVANAEKKQFLTAQKKHLEDIQNFIYKPKQIGSDDKHFEINNIENFRDTWNMEMNKFLEVPIEDLIFLAQEREINVMEAKDLVKNEMFYTASLKLMIKREEQRMYSLQRKLQDMQDLVYQAEKSQNEAKQTIWNQRRQKNIVKFNKEYVAEKVQKNDAYFDEKIEQKRQHHQKVRKELQYVLLQYGDLKDCLNLARDEHVRAVKKISQLDQEFREKNISKNETQYMIQSLDDFDVIAKVFLTNDPSRFFDENFDLRLHGAEGISSSCSSDSAEDEEGGQQGVGGFFGRKKKPKTTQVQTSGEGAVRTGATSSPTVAKQRGSIMPLSMMFMAAKMVKGSAPQLPRKLTSFGLTSPSNLATILAQPKVEGTTESSTAPQTSLFMKTLLAQENSAGSKVEGSATAIAPAANIGSQRQIQQQSGEAGTSELARNRKNRANKLADKQYIMRRINRFYKKHQFNIKKLFDSMGEYYRYYSNEGAILRQTIVDFELQKNRAKETLEIMTRELRELVAVEEHKQFFKNREEIQDTLETTTELTLNRLQFDYKLEKELHQSDTLLQQLRERVGRIYLRALLGAAWILAKLCSLLYEVMESAKQQHPHLQQLIIKSRDMVEEMGNKTGKLTSLDKQSVYQELEDFQLSNFEGTPLTSVELIWTVLQGGQDLRQSYGELFLQLFPQCFEAKNLFCDIILEDFIAKKFINKRTLFEFLDKCRVQYNKMQEQKNELSNELKKNHLKAELPKDQDRDEKKREQQHKQTQLQSSTPLGGEETFLIEAILSNSELLHEAASENVTRITSSLLNQICVVVQNVVVCKREAYDKLLETSKRYNWHLEKRGMMGEIIGNDFKKTQAKKVKAILDWKGLSVESRQASLQAARLSAAVKNVNMNDIVRMEVYRAQIGETHVGLEEDMNNFERLRNVLRNKFSRSAERSSPLREQQHQQHQQQQQQQLQLQQQITLNQQFSSTSLLQKNSSIAQLQQEAPEKATIVSSIVPQPTGTASIGQQNTRSEAKALQHKREDSDDSYDEELERYRQSLAKPKKAPYVNHLKGTKTTYKDLEHWRTVVHFKKELLEVKKSAKLEYRKRQREIQQEREQIEYQQKRHAKKTLLNIINSKLDEKKQAELTADTTSGVPAQRLNSPQAYSLSQKRKDGNEIRIYRDVVGKFDGQLGGNQRTSGSFSPSPNARNRLSNATAQMNSTGGSTARDKSALDISRTLTTGGVSTRPQTAFSRTGATETASPPALPLTTTGSVQRTQNAQTVKVVSYGAQPQKEGGVQNNTAPAAQRKSSILLSEALSNQQQHAQGEENTSSVKKSLKGFFTRNKQKEQEELEKTEKKMSNLWTGYVGQDAQYSPNRLQLPMSAREGFFNVNYFSPHRVIKRPDQGQQSQQGGKFTANPNTSTTAGGSNLRWEDNKNSEQFLPQTAETYNMSDVTCLALVQQENTKQTPSAASPKNQMGQTVTNTYKNSIVAAGTARGELYLLEVDSVQQCVLQVQRKLQVSQSCAVRLLATMPEKLVTVSDDMRLSIYNTRNGELLTSYNLDVQIAKVVAIGKLCAFFERLSTQVQLIDTKTLLRRGSLICENPKVDIEERISAPYNIADIAVDVQQSYLFVCTLQKTIFTWDLSKPKDPIRLKTYYYEQFYHAEAMDYLGDEQLVLGTKQDLIVYSMAQATLMQREGLWEMSKLYSIRFCEEWPLILRVEREGQQQRIIAAVAALKKLPEKKGFAKIASKNKGEEKTQKTCILTVFDQYLTCKTEVELGAELLAFTVLAPVGSRTESQQHASGLAVNSQSQLKFFTVFDDSQEDQQENSLPSPKLGELMATSLLKKSNFLLTSEYENSNVMKHQLQFEMQEDLEDFYNNYMDSEEEIDTEKQKSSRGPKISMKNSKNEEYSQEQIDEDDLAVKDPKFHEKLHYTCIELLPQKNQKASAENSEIIYLKYERHAQAAGEEMLSVGEFPNHKVFVTLSQQRQPVESNRQQTEEEEEEVNQQQQSTVRVWNAITMRSVYSLAASAHTLLCIDSYLLLVSRRSLEVYSMVNLSRWWEILPQAARGNTQQKSNVLLQAQEEEEEDEDYEEEVFFCDAVAARELPEHLFTCNTRKRIALYSIKQRRLLRDWSHYSYYPAERLLFLDRGVIVTALKNYLTCWELPSSQGTQTQENKELKKLRGREVFNNIPLRLRKMNDSSTQIFAVFEMNGSSIEVWDRQLQHVHSIQTTQTPSDFTLLQNCVVYSCTEVAGLQLQMLPDLLQKSQELARSNHDVLCIEKISDTLVLTGGREGRVFVWNVVPSHSREIMLHNVYDLGRAVVALRYFNAPSLRLFVAASENGELQVWRGYKEFVFSHKFDSGVFGLRTLAAPPYTEDIALTLHRFCVHGSQHMAIYSAESFAKLTEIPVQAEEAKMVSERWLTYLTNAHGSHIQVYDMRDLTIYRTFSFAAQMNVSVKNFAFLDSQHLVTAEHDQLRLWKLSAAQWSAREGACQLDEDACNQQLPSFQAKYLKAFLDCLFVVTETGAMYLLDAQLATKHRVGRTKLHNQQVQSGKADEEGELSFQITTEPVVLSTHVALCQKKNDLCAVRLDERAQKLQLLWGWGHPDSAYLHVPVSADFSRDGKIIFTAGDEGDLYRWSVKSNHDSKDLFYEFEQKRERLMRGRIEHLLCVRLDFAKRGGFRDIIILCGESVLLLETDTMLPLTTPLQADHKLASPSSTQTTAICKVQTSWRVGFCCVRNSAKTLVFAESKSRRIAICEQDEENAVWKTSEGCEWYLAATIVDLRSVRDDGDVCVAGTDVCVYFIDAYKKQLIKQLQIQCEGLCKIICSNNADGSDNVVTIDSFGIVKLWNKIPQQANEQGETLLPANTISMGVACKGSTEGGRVLAVFALSHTFYFLVCLQRKILVMNYLMEKVWQKLWQDGGNAQTFFSLHEDEIIACTEGGVFLHFIISNDYLKDPNQKQLESNDYAQEAMEEFEIE